MQRRTLPAPSPLPPHGLWLERSLFRRQRAAIAEALAARPRRHLAYEGRYRRRIARPHRPLATCELPARIEAAELLYVGDYATFPEAQEAFLALADLAAGLGRPVVLALQAFEASHQRALDAFLSGKLDLGRLRGRLGLSEQVHEARWHSLCELLQFARERRLEVLALDEPAGTLERWDALAASRIAARALAPDRPRVLVLAGQFHVAPCHLPARVERLLPAARSLVVYQNCEPVYWSLARSGALGRTAVVELGPRELCLLSGSPVRCQQSFLDLIEAEDGDHLLQGELTAEVGRLIHRIARTARLSPSAILADLRVTAEVGELLRAAERAGFSPAEKAQVRAHVLSRESGYFPRAGLIYLASRSRHHAAEEAAHRVRHVAVGRAMTRPRTEAGAFYAACLEEAVAFFGSRLACPERPAPDLDDWTLALRGGAHREAAAFVLAHKAAERDGTFALLPRPGTRPFQAVVHGLGYLLGDAMDRAYRRRSLRSPEIARLFRDPFGDPRAAYFAWCARLGA